MSNVKEWFENYEQEMELAAELSFLQLQQEEYFQDIIEEAASREVK